jgi:hypothetical protein
MIREKKGFIFYKSFYEAIKELSNEQQLKLYQAIFEYSFEEKNKKLEGISKSIFTLIKPQLEANHRKFLNGCKGAEHGNKGAEHGKKGGRPRNENPPENPPNDEAKNPPKNPPKDKVKDKDKDKDKKTKAKKDFFDLDVPDYVNKEILKDFIDTRKNSRSPMNKQAFKLLIKKIKDFKEQGQDIDKCLEEAILSNWKSIYPLKESRQSKPPININTKEYNYGASGKF